MWWGCQVVEKFSAAKLVKSPFTAMYWIKTIMFGLGLAFLIGVGYCVYRVVVKPLPTTTQQAQQITNIEVNNPEDTFFMGLKLFGLKLGVSKPTIKTMKQVVQESKK